MRDGKNIVTVPRCSGFQFFLLVASSISPTLLLVLGHSHFLLCLPPVGKSRFILITTGNGRISP